MYQQYRQQYQRQAKLGMQDTMGQAAAMNGGYGSSYAQMAGQQAYNSEMQKLSDRMPELYQLALDKYQQEGQELLQRWQMASQMENQDYSRYQDQMAAWRSDRDYAANRYDSERSTDYNLWADSDDREYSRFQDQQQMAQAQVDYLISIGAEVPDSLLEASGYGKEYIEAIKAARAAAGSGSGGSSTKQWTLTDAATEIAKEMGTTAAMKFVQEHTRRDSQPEYAMARDNVRGYELTKKMLAAMNAKK